MISKFIFQRHYVLFVFILFLKYSPCFAGNVTDASSLTTETIATIPFTSGNAADPPAPKTTKTPRLQIIPLANMSFETEGKNNSRYMSGKIAALSNIAVSRCAEECFRKANCESINFNIATMECELLKSGNEVTVVSEGWTYFKSIDWIQNISTSCKRNTCSGSAKCMDLSNGEPYCIITHCDRPQDLNGAKLSSEKQDDFRVGKTIRYSCEPSVQHTGNAEITCQSDGTWTTTTFECRCGEPPSVSGVSLGSGRGVGTTLTYTCNSPLLTFGSTTSITCQSNGAWSSSSTDVYCECSTYPSANSGTYFHKKNGRGIGKWWYVRCNYDYSSGCSYCHGHGYVSYTSCQSDGSWSNMDYYCT